MPELTCLEACAGADRQSLGLKQAGFSHVAAVEIDADACATLRLNRQHEWEVVMADVRHFDGRPCHGVDFLAGGVPCAGGLTIRANVADRKDQAVTAAISAIVEKTAR